MNQPVEPYFGNYKELLDYCYGLIKIDQESLITRVDSDFQRNFRKAFCQIRDEYHSIFHQKSTTSDFSLKIPSLDRFRHRYSNYEEVLNQLQSAKIKSMTSLRYVDPEDLYYHNVLSNVYAVSLDSSDISFSGDKIPIRKAIYIDIKTAVTNNINNICVSRIYDNYQVLENARLARKAEQLEKEKAEQLEREKAERLGREVERSRLEKEYQQRQDEALRLEKLRLTQQEEYQQKILAKRLEEERLLLEEKNLQEEITRLGKILQENWSLVSADCNAVILKREAERHREKAFLTAQIWPMHWVSLLLLLSFFSGIANSVALIFGIILGLPFLIPFVKFLIADALYLEKRPIYLSKLQTYRGNHRFMILDYEAKIESFHQKYKKDPQYLREYTFKEIDRRIAEVQK